jgi:hypothetical protein
MAKKDKAAADAEVTPAFGDEFGSEIAPAETKIGPGAVSELDLVREELQKERAKTAELEAKLATTSKAYPAGKKYRVSLKDAPTLVVRSQDGEHPWEAAKRLGGILSSTNTPEISEAADHEVCGVYIKDKLIRPFKV